MGVLQFARSRYCAEWGGTVSLQVDSDYRHKQESFKPNEMCGSPRSRDTGLFLSYHVVSAEGLQLGRFGRGTSTGSLQLGRFGRGASAGGFGRGASAGAHRQEASTGGFGRRLRQGRFGRGTSTFSKYYEFPVTINGNIRLYCGTTRKRLQEKDYKRKQ